MSNQNKYLKGIFLFMIAALVLAAAGCNANVDAPYSGDVNTGLKAAAAVEGIRLDFEHIPPETTRIFINIIDWGESEKITGINDITSSFADIKESSLNQIKESGGVTFPFVQSGHKYYISACFQKEGERDAANAEWVSAECAALSGIYFDGGLELNLNETKTVVSLSAEPVFSKAVDFSPDKYRYGVTVKNGEHWSIGVGEKITGKALSWNFEPEVSNDLIASGYLENGDYPARANVFCNAVYDNITWSVELAQSKEFTISLK